MLAVKVFTELWTLQVRFLHHDIRLENSWGKDSRMHGHYPLVLPTSLEAK